MRALLNSLGPVTHILAGLIPLSFAITAGIAESSLPLVMAVLFFSLLPDIDSSQSVAGRIFSPVAQWLETTYGHRTLTHTAAFAAGVGLFLWLWLPGSDWWLVWCAWLSHLFVDMCIGQHGLPLLWPLTDLHFYLIAIKPRSAGELLFAAGCALLTLLPFYDPSTAHTAAQLLGQEPIPTATPELLEIRIDHVYDPTSEILVAPGQRIERGQLIADLATYRHRQLDPTPPAPAQPASAIQLADHLHVAGDPTALAKLLTPTPNHSELQARLREAEFDLALARAEFGAVMRSPAEAHEKQLAELKLQKAEADYQLAVLRATPTATPTPTPTPTPKPTAAPQGDLIRAVVSGRVVEVKVAAVSGEEATVIIAVEAAGSRGESASVVRVIDGDTILVSLAGREETVRLIGVDTPETKHPDRGVECYGPEASGWLTDQLPPGRAVKLEPDAEARDRYGRRLAYVWAGERMLNRELVRLGYARPLAIEPNTTHAAEFQRLAEEARAGRVGLWGRCE